MPNKTEGTFLGGVSSFLKSPLKNGFQEREIIDTYPWFVPFLYSSYRL
ncbi:hypothetical protein B4064_0664 [Caldibacillus thermoamylovorans]|nr:hypothetical protein B4065_0716 [Caldibacillus thermoamylovorans]KIO67404.1 hypothetical protein B4064_0664 [Caldibacillus thermoamylovorans]